MTTPPRPSKDAKGTSLQLEAGGVIDGYKLVDRLGKGGFGEVWKAHGADGILVALKFVVIDEKAGTVEQRALDLIKNTRHANLVFIFRAWKRDPYLVFAMELGERTLLARLEEVLAQGLPGIPRDELMEYMRDAARGIDFLNQQKIQHRDIKPHNLLVLGGSVKVSDFGLAKLMEHTVSQHSGSMTPAYAAPEFLKNETSPFSDQYSLAVSYCQLRGGRLPFGGNAGQIVTGHLMMPPDLTMLPAGERPIVARALAKAPKERWPSCRAFADALAAAAPAEKRKKASKGPPSRTAPNADTAPDPLPSSQTNTAIASGIGVRRLIVPLGIAGAVLFVVAIALVFGKTRGDSKSMDQGSNKASDLATDRMIAAKNGAPKTAEDGRGNQPPPAKDGAVAKANGNAGENIVPPKPPGERKIVKTRPASAVSPFGMTQARQLQQEWAGYLGVPVEEDIDLGGGVKLTVVVVPPGSFQMGSPTDDNEADADEKPAHRVTITQPMRVGKYEITIGQFKRFVAEKSYTTEPEESKQGGWGYNATEKQWEGWKPQYTWRNPGFAVTDSHPVANVTWNDAQRFCQWLEARTAKKVRLLRDAEWEYSCRAGTTTRRYNGDEPEKLAQIANVADASASARFNWNYAIKADDRFAFTAPVGEFKPNAFGLYDMIGNVWEWCEDGKRTYDAVAKEDPVIAAAARVLRGGSFHYYPRYCRAAFRGVGTPIDRSGRLGFRVVIVR